MKVMLYQIQLMKHKLKTTLIKLKAKETKKIRIMEQKRKMLKVMKISILRTRRKFLMKSLKNRRFLKL